MSIFKKKKPTLTIKVELPNLVDYEVHTTEAFWDRPSEKTLVKTIQLPKSDGAVAAVLKEHDDECKNPKCQLKNTVVLRQTKKGIKLIGLSITEKHSEMTDERIKDINDRAKYWADQWSKATGDKVSLETVHSTCADKSGVPKAPQGKKK